MYSVICNKKLVRNVVKIYTFKPAQIDIQYNLQNLLVMENANLGIVGSGVIVTVC